MKKYIFIDLDGTLINTVSGKTFAEDVTDFRIRKNVLDKLKEMKPEFIFIVTNQGAIPKYTTEGDFRAKLSAIAKFTGLYTRVPTQAMYCASMDKDNPYRKPNTGMLETLLKTYVKKVPDFKEMLMIGDASGKEGQFSDSDKKTAENFKIDYIDVEDFLKEEPKDEV